MIASCSSRRSKRSSGGRERDAVGGVLAVVPAGAEAELDPAAAHLVDARDRDRERARVPEGGRGDQRARAGSCWSRRRGRRGWSRRRTVRARPDPSPILQVVVGAEERVEAEVFRRLGDAAERGVAGPLLGLGEDPQSHAVLSSRMPASPRGPHRRLPARVAGARSLATAPQAGVRGQALDGGTGVGGTTEGCSQCTPPRTVPAAEPLAPGGHVDLARGGRPTRGAPPRRCGRRRRCRPAGRASTVRMIAAQVVADAGAQRAL